MDRQTEKPILPLVANRQNVANVETERADISRIKLTYTGCAGCGTTEGVIGSYCGTCRWFY